MSHDDLPEFIADEQQLDDLLTQPSPQLIEDIRGLSSPLVVLGAGGKMGPSLAALAKRAADAAGHDLDVVAVSRFSSDAVRDWLQSRGVTIIPADLMHRDEYCKLPDTENVVYMLGQKFGTATNPSLTWAANSIPPLLTMERYRQARIVALSTGNVYPLAPVAQGGSREEDPLTPLGEYANAAVARERLFEYLSREQGTPVAQMRLSYAMDLRYGVITDIAGRIARGEPVPLATGHFNGIWQGDANEMILRSFPLAAAPPEAFNLSSARIFSIRETALRLGELLGREPTFEGEETGTAFISETTKLNSRLGPPRVDWETLTRWTAHWVQSGGRTLGKPVHFETRDGAY